MSSYTAISFPDVLPASMSWGLHRFDGQYTSPLDGSTSTVRRGARWVCDMSWKHLGLAKMQELGAFLSQMADRTNMALVQNYAYTAQGTLGGTPEIYALSSAPAWAASTTYAANGVVRDSNGNLQQVTTAGTSAAAAPTWPATTGTTITDGTVTWTCRGPWNSANIYTWSWPSNSTPVQPGDFLQLPGGQLVRVTAAASTFAGTGDGQCVIPVTPDVRDPTTAGAIVTSNPSCYMQLKSQGISEAISAPHLGGFSASFIEVIS